MPRRIVEFEIKAPELHLPKVNLEPARRVAESAVLTGIGIVVLTGRAIAHGLRTANAAGVEAAKHPGPVTRTLLGLVRSKPVQPSTAQAVVVLPIADYDQLAEEDIIGRLPSLAPGEVRALLAYEREHQNRESIVAAMAALVP